ncbi:MAG: hypothetical protein SAJ37_09215 [Oscillatoria sp. PMC 1068.18]|nr:hypothetical protein [Oscillatoria sp. PMC 1076.18]MEC4988914.1 hypothetical protein [Oscillatoria sp. PMC 1068.18]
MQVAQLTPSRPQVYAAKELILRPTKPKLLAKWYKIDGKLICKWVSE